MLTLYPSTIRYIGNSPVLIQKIKEYLKHSGYDMTHYHDAPADGACDYFFIIDPIEQETKRLRLQELWKRELQKQASSVKMLVFDWWACDCNGFISPMDIPSSMPKLLEMARPLYDIEECQHCHQIMENGMNHLFKPHGDVSPLIKARYNISSMIGNIEKRNFSNIQQIFNDVQKIFTYYEGVLSESEFITIQTPYKDDFQKLRQHLAAWRHGLVISKDTTNMENIWKDMGNCIKEINLIKANIGFKD